MFKEWNWKNHPATSNIEQDMGEPLHSILLSGGILSSCPVPSWCIMPSWNNEPCPDRLPFCSVPSSWVLHSSGRVLLSRKTASCGTSCCISSSSDMFARCIVPVSGSGKKSFSGCAFWWWAIFLHWFLLFWCCVFFWQLAFFKWHDFRWCAFFGRHPLFRQHAVRRQRLSPWSTFAWPAVELLILKSHEDCLKAKTGQKKKQKQRRATRMLGSLAPEFSLFVVYIIYSIMQRCQCGGYVITRGLPCFSYTATRLVSIWWIWAYTQTYLPHIQKTLLEKTLQGHVYVMFKFIHFCAFLVASHHYIRWTVHAHTSRI